MKKFELEVNGNNYIVMGDSLQDIWPEEMPKVWSENLSRVTETDITQEMEKGERKSKKRERVEALLGSEKILDYLENLFTDIENDTQPEQGE